MWLYELNELKLQYSKFKLTREKLQMENKVKKVKKLKMKKIKKKN